MRRRREEKKGREEKRAGALSDHDRLPAVAPPSECEAKSRCELSRAAACTPAPYGGEIRIQKIQLAAFLLVAIERQIREEAVGRRKRPAAGDGPGRPAGRAHALLPAAGGLAQRGTGRSGGLYTDRVVRSVQANAKERRRKAGAPKAPAARARH